MPWIENIAVDDVHNGVHRNPGENCMLIRIADPDYILPEPKHYFKEVHCFKFLDIEEEDFALDDNMKCTGKQAADLVALLQHALDKQMNVVVHCFMGVSRSGAVCEVGVLMGFDDTEKFRAPNLLVKNRMLQALGYN